MIVDWVVRVSCVLIALTVCGFLLRRQAASVRHTLWFAAVVSVFVVPTAMVAFPDWHILPARDVPAVVQTFTRSVPVERLASVPPAVGVDESVATPVRETVTEMTSVPSVIPGPTSSFVLPTVSPGTVWLVGTVLFVLVTIIGIVRLVTLASSQVPLLRREWNETLRDVAEELGVSRRVRLLVSESTVTPMTWGVVRPVILLPATCVSWDADKRLDVLRHEVAHIARNDFAAQLIANVACAVFWFHPMVWMAARHMRAAGEQACDDAVLAAGSTPSGYAEHLLAVARGMSRTRNRLPAVAMARNSKLSDRVTAVLAEDVKRSNHVGGSRMTFSITTLLTVPFALAQAAPPAPAAAPAPIAHPAPVVAPQELETPAPLPVATPAASPAAAAQPGAFASPQPAQRQETRWASAPSCSDRAGSGSRSLSESVNDDDRWDTSWRDRECTGSARIDGEVQFTSDFRGVASLSRNGRFNLEIDDGDISREVRYRNRDGSLERRWYVDGDQQTWGAEAEEWVALALIDYFRHSSYKLDERVAVLLDEGVDALLAEASNTHGSHLRRRYYSAAIASGQMSDDQVASLLERAAGETDSDHELGRLLRSVSATHLHHEGVRRAFLSGANTMESDHERGRVLRTMLEQDGLDENLVLALLRSAGDMESDHEVGRVLMASADRFLGSAALQRAYLGATAGMGSDHEHGRVLRALLDRDDIEPSVRANVYQSAANMDSDHEVSRLLRHGLDTHGLSDADRDAFFRTLSSVDSDHEQQRILTAVANVDPMDVDNVSAAMRLMRGIDSDHNLARLILTYHSRYGSNETVHDALLDLAEMLDSDAEHRRVMRALSGR